MTPRDGRLISAHRRRRIVALIGLLGAVLFVLSTATFVWLLQRLSTVGDDGWFAASPTVVEVIDGDTIDVRIGRSTRRVRLLGIDTPETKDPRKPVQCFGHEASIHTAELLPKGTIVRLEHDLEEHDVYGRTLAYVWRESDGTFVNLDLALGGFADVLSIAPNTMHAGDLRAAVDDAHAAGRGLWGTCGGPGRPAS